MSDKQTFDPEKLSIIEFKFIKGQVDTPEEFDMKKIQGYHIENDLELAFNLEEKLAKTDYSVKIQTKSKGKNSKEATGDFHLVFIFKVENLDELTKLVKNTVNFQSALGNALSSITYSTSRGILLTRLQGTALQNFILPVINPNKLLHSK